MPNQGLLRSPWARRNGFASGKVDLLYKRVGIGRGTTKADFEKFLFNATGGTTAPTYVASTSFSGSTSIVLNVPAGTANGDWMGALISFEDRGTITPPSGWTLVATNLNDNNPDGNSALKFYTRQASSEPGSYTWTSSVGGVSGVMFTYTGSAGFGVVTSAYNVFGSTFNLASATMSDQSIAVTAFDIDNSSLTATPSGVTQRQYISNATSGRNGIWFGDQGPVSAGTYGPKSATSGATPSWAGFTIEVLGTTSGGSISSGVGSASGTGTATGVGGRTVGIAATAAGIGAATATGAATTAATASAIGTGAASAAASGVVGAVGTTAGVSTVTATGLAISVQSATAAAAGTSTVQATSAVIVAGTGSAAGTGTAAGVTAATSASSGTSAGAGVASGTGAATGAATASTAGVGAASATGQAFVAATATGAGTGAASGAGAATAPKE